ncbi:MAG TPA: hypothetical protein EYP24_04495 [bacterium (Candidatus Stahlbacteria)]|nr:hypothetical protein [Candidatus Stahlbacteria bacterium]
MVRVKIKIMFGKKAVETPAIVNTGYSAEHEDEVLISDSLASMLKIVIEDPKDGLWRFRDEPTTQLRPSEKPVFW